MSAKFRLMNHNLGIWFSWGLPHARESAIRNPGLSIDS